MKQQVQCPRNLKKLCQLNILCIGQPNSGKTKFLRNYTQDNQQQFEIFKDVYSIYAKKLNNFFVFFHQLSEEENVFLQQKFDGILFFIDFVNSWYAVQNVLKWIQLLSKFTGTNIFKIPIRIIVVNFHNHEQNLKSKWKSSLQKQLITIVKARQILYLDSKKTSNILERKLVEFDRNIKIQKNNHQQSKFYIQEKLLQYFVQINEGRTDGISPTYRNHIRLYGVKQMMRTFNLSIRLTFFRAIELAGKFVIKKLRVWTRTKIL